MANINRRTKKERWKRKQGTASRYLFARFKTITVAITISCIKLKNIFDRLNFIIFFSLFA